MLDVTVKQKCPRCFNPIEGGQEACECCGFALGSFSVVPSSAPHTILAKGISRPKIPVPITLGVTVDRTGSSKQFEAGVPATFGIVAEQLSQLVTDLEVWLASHGNLDQGQDFIMLNSGSSADEAIEEIQNITFDGGGHPHEHHLDAINSLVDQVAWPFSMSEGRGAIVAFMTADSLPLKSGASIQDLAVKLREKNLLLYLICQPTPNLYRLAVEADGLLLEISNAPDPDEFRQIASKISESIRVSTTRGSTIPLLEGEIQ